MYNNVLLYIIGVNSKVIYFEIWPECIIFNSLTSLQVQLLQETTATPWKTLHNMCLQNVKVWKMIKNMHDKKIENRKNIIQLEEFLAWNWEKVVLIGGSKIGGSSLSQIPIPDILGELSLRKEGADCFWANSCTIHSVHNIVMISLSIQLTLTSRWNSNKFTFCQLLPSSAKIFHA